MFFDCIETWLYSTNLFEDLGIALSFAILGDSILDCSLIHGPSIGASQKAALEQGRKTQLLVTKMGLFWLVTLVSCIDHICAM